MRPSLKRPFIKISKLETLDDAYVGSQIKNSYFKGHSFEKAFREVCRKLGFYPLPSVKTASEIVQRFLDKDETLEDDFDLNYIELISKINEYYNGKLRHAIFHGNSPEIQCGSRFENMPDQRYKIKCDEKLGFSALNVFDYFHGLERKIQIIDSHFASNTNFKQNYDFYVLSMNRILLCEWISLARNFYLLKLDYGKQECHVLDQQTFSSYCEIFVNLTDRLEFLGLFHESDRRFASLGRIKNDKIDFNQNERKPFPIHQNRGNLHTNLRNSEVINQKLCFLNINDEDVEEDEEEKIKQIEYHEIDLLNIIDETVINSLKFVFKLGESVSIKSERFANHGYYWTEGKICYLTVEYHTERKPSIYAFNILTQNCVPVNFTYDDSYERISFKNDVMYLKDRDTLYRYPLRRPDPLQYLVWFKIRRQTMLNKNGLYEKALKLLPLNSYLQPFSIQ